MKKIILIFLTLALVTSCENEPLEADLTGSEEGGNDGGDDGSESGDLTLSVYELDTDVRLVFFGIPIQTITNSDLNISNNKVVSGINAFSANGSPFETEDQTITRNNSGQIISDTSVNSDGVTTNETLTTYTNGNATRITYNYLEDDEDDFDYNFTYDGNTITRTEVGSTISTVFTLDGFDRVIKKESFDGDFSIQTETVTYTGNGNINSSTSTGEVEGNTTYVFDDNTNPLKVVYEDNYLLKFLADDYSDEIGAQIAQFLSTNNWNGATFDGEVFTFDLEYNSVGRVISRDIAYDFGPEFAFEFNEKFNYVN